MSNPKCPKCHSPEIIKSGQHLGRQRYRCKGCGFQFTRTESRGRPASEKAMAVTLYTMGLSLNAIARLFKVSTPAVLRWIRLFAEGSVTEKDCCRKKSNKINHINNHEYKAIIQ